jgi:predicted RNA-binding Zn-ribbon protein involved in translation (DUF1610 family)
MSLEQTQVCPACGNDTFWRTASMRVQLGEKVKWRCTACEYGYIAIDGVTTLPADG